MTSLLTLPAPTLKHPSAALARTAAAALAVAAGAHLAAFPGHRSEGVPAGGFFLAVAVLQLAAAMTILPGAGRRIRAAMIVGNVALIALWAWSRTAGVPVGPHPGNAEAVGPLDLTAVAAQLLAVVAVLFVPRNRPYASLVQPRLALVGLALVVGAGGAGLLPGAHADQHHDSSQLAPARAAATTMDPHQPRPATATHIRSTTTDVASTGDQAGDKPSRTQHDPRHEDDDGHSHP